MLTSKLFRQIRHQNNRRCFTTGSAEKCVLVNGGGGQLGRSVVKRFAQENWKVLSVDFHQPEPINSSHITYNLIGDQKADAESVSRHLEKFGKDQKLDAVISVAGGWAGGNILAEDIFESTEQMLKMNLMSSLFAANIAGKHMNKNGFLLLTGSMASTLPTPDMLGYGVSKSATHHLVKSLATSNVFPEGVVVAGMLPGTLDTETNRKFMKDQDKSSWTPLPDLVEEIYRWCSLKWPRPHNGALVEIRTNDLKTSFHPVVYVG